MEELQDASIHHTASKVIAAFKTIKHYDPLYKSVQKLACNPAVDKNDMRNTLEQAIKTAGLDTEIHNIVYHLVRNKYKLNECTIATLQATTDPLAYLKRAGVQWDRRVRKSLSAMCNELKMPMNGQSRVMSDREELVQKWEELSNYNIDLSNYRPVYAPKDLLDVLLSLKGPARLTEKNEFVQIPKWEFSHIALPVKNLFELRIHFAELLKPDNFPSMETMCRRSLDAGHAPICQHLLKRGNIPTPYRGRMWSLVLGSQLNDFDVETWHKLRNNVLATDHIVDKLVFKDIQLTASNDDQYFVFEDVLYQVMLCFTRDNEIAEIVQFENPNPAKGKQNDAPPSSVVPFHGICMFAAPFCYLYDSPISLYFTFRAFYTRYCHRLITINTHPQGIVSLCLMYEKLLQTHEPKLWGHFRELQIQPIRIVFKWIMRGFSGHLPPDQLLILWDLILGFDTLEILPLFALILISFRKESLLQVKTLDNIESILADLSSIKVLPLIQMALVRD